jgi:hypothetical protein
MTSSPSPYPTAQSVNGLVGGAGISDDHSSRPASDPRRQRPAGRPPSAPRTVWGGDPRGRPHPYFPMVINLTMPGGVDGRGAEQLVQYEARKSGSRTFLAYASPRHRRAVSHQVPIMTNSESVLQFGNKRLRQSQATALKSCARPSLTGFVRPRSSVNTPSDMFKRPTPYDFSSARWRELGRLSDLPWRGGS